MVIGVTGGVGCGKSTVLDLLEHKYGARLLIADNLGHEAMKPGSTVYQNICDAFGAEIVTTDGTIDRNHLSKLVYADVEKLALLNSLIHPYVYQYMKEQLEEWSDVPLIVIETAILFETGCQKLCDEIWGIVTDKELRIKRLSASRGYTREKAESIMAKQLSEKELREKCSHVIINDGNLLELEHQIQELLGIK